MKRKYDDTRVDTVIYLSSGKKIEYEVDVEYYYTPYDEGDGYFFPPEGGEVNVIKVEYKSRDITRWINIGWLEEDIALLIDEDKL